MKTTLDYLFEWTLSEPWKVYLVEKIHGEKNLEIDKLLDDILMIIYENNVYEFESNYQLDSDTTKLIINEVHTPQNINALSAEVYFSLGERLNVFFGENGTGKSSYVRVFRKLAENYYTSKKHLEILPNVYNETENSKQTIKVNYSNQNISQEEIVNINEFHPILSKINVFDSDSVFPLIDDEITFKILPKGFEYFAIMSNLFDDLREEIKRRILNLENKKYLIFSAINKEIIDEELKILFSSIWDYRQVQDYLSFNYPYDEEQEMKKNNIKSKIEELKTTNLEDKLKLLILQSSKLKSIMSSLKKYAYTLSNENYLEINKLIDEYNRILSDEKIFNEGYKKNISYILEVNDSWIEFINNGVNYYKSINKESVVDGDVCIFCSTPLNKNAVTIIDSHIKNNIDNAMIKEAIIDSLNKHYNKHKLLNIEDEECILFENYKLMDKIKSILEIINDNLDMFNDSISERVKLNDKHTMNFEPLILEINCEIENLEERITNLKSNKEDFSKLIDDFNNELLELEKIKLINSLTEEIIQWIKLNSEQLKYERLKNEFNTTKLTKKQKEAFKELVESEYLQQFQSYAEELKIPNINIGLSSKKGKMYRGKYIVRENYRVSSVMSEGEQKAIAMVEFATDLKLRNDFNTVLFDDPVTSLDYKRAEMFAELIYKLSLERQVIVFTHDIMFYYFLYNLCKKDDKDENKFFKVDSHDTLNKGFVSESFSGRLETLKDITKKINQHEQVINSKNCLGDELENRLKIAYSDIRTWCELIVEEGFFKSVIRRYEPNIMFSKVKHINGDFVAELEDITNLFDKSCRWMAGHSQAQRTQFNKATKEAFNEDIIYIKKIYEKFK